MSVLRKRSPWIIPAASLLLGALTLGLAGCGGGGGDEFPNNNPPPRTIPLPAGVTPNVTTASTPTPVIKGQGANLHSTADPNESGGITDITVAIPDGVIQEDDTLGIEVVPTAQSLLTKANNNPATSGITPIAEIQFGSVENGNINTSRPIVFGGSGATINIKDQVADFAELANMVQSGQCVIVARRFVNGSLVPINDCTVTLDIPNQSVTLVGNCSGDIVITCDSVHVQGGVG
jgi:hypothetical protein